jgi:hypothetical protein
MANRSIKRNKNNCEEYEQLIVKYSMIREMKRKIDEYDNLQNRVHHFSKVSRYFYENVAEQIIAHYYKKHQKEIVNEGFSEIMGMIAAR